MRNPWRIPEGFKIYVESDQVGHIRTPEDQKAKMIGVAKAVADDEDYQTLVVGNPDQQAVEAAMIAIVDRVMRKQRKGDMSLYKEYQHNEGFKQNFINIIDRMLGDLEYIR